ncbi:response regulator [uncultured Treponema sp.]|uniref:response regulator n=1 Tax=uncultured Treponema sp. TaxID=162155 RepID=UPI0025CE4FCE|nr:response regulator [uncultured Treponema sp.]
MESKKRNLKISLLGGIAVVIILVGGTFLTGRSSSSDTGQAVRTVSLLFMTELTSRREQVVAKTLSDYITDMDIALGLMEKDDISSVEKLQAYQARMKQLYGLEKFAFVDTHGLIYTSRGTRTDIDLYQFDYNTLASPEISIKNQDGDHKKVIVAVPVDRIPFNGQTLVVCFMEIDMNKMLEGVSLQADNNSTTFCNIYTKNGIALSDMVLGGLASENNLLKALENASFEKGYSLEKMKADFSNRDEGAASFTYNNIRGTMYYIPVHNTDWMITYLIRESIISDQIGSISDGIILKSVLLSLIIALVLATLFAYVVVQNRKNAKLTLEREVSEAENRIKQEELEEQLALQQQITRQERKRSEQDNMITALASDYRSVYYIDLDSDDGICYRKGSAVVVPFKEGEHLSFSKVFSDYALNYVSEEYREKFLAFISPENIREALNKSPLISFRYLVKVNGTERYEMMKMAGVRKQEERVDGKIHFIGMGISDIDSEMRDSLAKSQALSDALKAAEEASKAKTVFLSNMSHEIRTPMNAIIGLDSLALHDPEISDKTRDYLQKIGSSAEHLLSLINDILDMSRIESGRMVIKNEEFAFSKLLAQVNTIFSGQCEEKGLEYTCRVNGTLSDYYLGDDMKIRQILINILGNAVKFTPQGGSVSLDIEKTAEFDKKSTIRFKISDTGIGMSKEYLPKIFETFSQENSGAANKYGSSGLGLAITKSIVEMMNGNIVVESEKGKGSTFTVTITLQNSERKTEENGEEIEIKTEDMSVLIVDDDKIAVEHAKLVLENAGFKADTALSGKDAVEMVKLRHARREPYNLIIVDWQMPEIDGVETARLIREATGDESAIIILTAYNWDDIFEEALKAGVDSFIAKPIFTSNLIEAFKEALKKKQKEALSEKKTADLKGKRILLAEDMEVNAQIMIEVLSLREMQAEHAANGKIAVEMFSSHEPGYYDAILMDMRMPEMDGLEATEAIRKLDRSDSKTIPIIALTANAFDEDVQRSLQAGLNAHLSKPIQPDVLFETLEGML